jgi:hypothetical protein
MSERKHPQEEVQTLHEQAYWRGLDRAQRIVRKEIKRLEQLDKALEKMWQVVPGITAPKRSET